MAAHDLAEAIQERMPSRTMLEALYNVDRWSGFDVTPRFRSHLELE